MGKDGLKSFIEGKRETFVFGAAMYIAVNIFKCPGPITEEFGEVAGMVGMV